MYYSSFGILALIHHLIINYDILKNGRSAPATGPQYRYRQFLNAILVFYVADLLWGFLVEWRLYVLAYADTAIFFIAMALSVLLWTRFVVAYLGKDGVRARAFLAAGWGIFFFVIVCLIGNFFYPVIFEFSKDTEYTPGPGRYILLISQLILFFMVSVYSLIVTIKAEGRDRIHYRVVCVSGAVMAVFIILQSFDAFAPFYTIGVFFANCLIHVFVEEDEKREQDRITADAQKEKERYTQISGSLAEDYEAIYYINIETGRFMEISASEKYRSMNVPQEGRDFYSETRENARRYAHPDDRDFAESLYYKDTMLRNLQGKKSYSYKYRIMVGDEARYYRFVVMLSEDRKHFVLCDKDIQDTMTDETGLMEKEKTHITFSRIAESLASNYDVIFYVNIDTGSYTGYSSQDIYGGLQVQKSGDDFFSDTVKSLSQGIHPQDRERMISVIDRDYLISSLEGRKQVDFEYRLIVDDRSEHTRLSARKSSDGQHLIIGIENIDEEVRKEKEHLHALNTEKELARRDELTGTRNKTAFTELEQSVQTSMDQGMDHRPFAIAVCDINDLKKVNDTKGHKAGDEHIRASAKILCDIFDHSPVFRIGGDEFAIFLSGDDFESRNDLIEKLHGISEENRKGRRGPVIAVGMSEYDPKNDSDVTAIFDRADHLMYEDKRRLKGA
ncbi:MAG: diguanylate cyclase [Lachnospiraceae bacterium]|nr:diguanylate cyclase [Lachnospiraceae bacterium]